MVLRSPTLPLTEENTMPSTEEKNEPNAELFQNWERVFRKMEGFENCVCLRRVRCPNRFGDMDFLLINRGPDPKLGLVECEGLKTGKKETRAPKGIDQVLAYLAAFVKFEGDGKTILNESIRDAFDTGKLRGRNNAERWSSIEEFTRVAGDPGAELPPPPRPDRGSGAMKVLSNKHEAGFVSLLERASRKIVPVLLYYRKTALLRDEEQLLALAFKNHRLYTGAVRWPSADRLLSGRHV